MNVKRFTGKNSREAMQKVRLAFGDNAVVLSTKPANGGVEVLAMAPESVAAIERFNTAHAPLAPAAAAPEAPLSALRQQAQPSTAETPVQNDVKTLAMSTLSFQDYVRERMLKKRDAELRAQAQQAPLSAAVEQRLAAREVPAAPAAPMQPVDGLGLHDLLSGPTGVAPAPTLHDVVQPEASALRRQAARKHVRLAEPAMDEPPAAHEIPAPAPAPRAAAPEQRVRRQDPSAAVASTRRETPAVSDEQAEMMRELRAMKGMIEERFGALAFMERLQKSPKQAQLTTKLMDCGFSPALIRKLADSMPEDVGDEIVWSGEVLQRNLSTGENDPALEDQGGVFALVGSTGVGKTTSTAKLAAAFATRHGAGNLGLITLDAYRLGAHEQLRAYGRILGVPVHTAHDRVALEDLLDLLSAKKMVLIDTAGLAQRDTRTRELLEMLSHPSVKRLLVVNASAQGETIDDVLQAYKAANAAGIVLSKLDEAVKLGPALDAMIRHRLKVVAVANGQRVPEDWHRLTAQALIHRALRNSAAPAWRVNSNDVNLMFSTPPTGSAASGKRSSGRTPRGA
jgi:flagellar biosynthesis protein FlhF